MNLITKDSDYAIRSLAYMARRPLGGIVSVGELSDELAIPRPYLRRILQILTRHGLLRSYRGISGGFELHRAPDRIRIFDVVRIFQGSVELTRCVFRQKACPRIRACLLRRTMKAMEAHISRRLRALTIASLHKRR
jgi:Rrf2 family protein